MTIFTAYCVKYNVKHLIMTLKFVYIDLEKEETYTGADIKAISLEAGISYNKLAYRLRNSNLYYEEGKFVISRLTKHCVSNRNPSQYVKNGHTFEKR